MSGLYRSIRDDILTLWNAGWTHSTVPVYWRSDDADPLPDPSDTPYFLRNQVDFGAEKVLAFGGGRAANLKGQFGSVVVVAFVSRATQSEDTLLDYLADAMGIFRSQRVAGTYGASSSLSFIGDGSGVDVGPDESGNWFVRGARMVFEYRFTG